MYLALGNIGEIDIFLSIVTGLGTSTTDLDDVILLIMKILVRELDNDVVLIYSRAVDKS